ncbi:hypothetical protein PSECIP111854_00766 [Pseudoalteromonas sp. CIP111854]|uniref:Big-1 domain-containing protein n=1 Tax=Pseudoalteromonas holothuriae TaxID=2963714 RepID=A0A9W4QSS8_9GAMM|nr:hypothetical protein [Pseudoalteromonas sp. CIP111854]CAH9051542.1 hypothetical protein PSECIP111854_00766 [Pseudoalteromonas sp. CIP111854]
MPFMRWFSMLMLGLLLTACGGGGSIEKTTNNGDGTPATESDITLTVVVADDGGNALNEGNPIKQGAAGTVTATLLQDGEPVANKLVQFQLNQSGRLSPESGVSATNSEGIATLSIESGETKGWGEVVASYTVSEGSVVTSTAVFYSLGDETNANGDITFTIAVADSEGNAFDETYPIEQGRSGIATATLSQDGKPLTDKLIQFQLNHSGRLSPESGTGATNAQGVATITIDSGENRGWGEVTASYTQSEGNVATSKTVFYSSGDEADAEDDSTKLNIKVLANCPSGWESERDNVSLDTLSSACTETNRIDAITEVDVLVGASSTKSGQGIAGVLINLAADIGTILSGEKSVSDNFGFALFKYRPPLQGGAGQLTATFNDVSTSFAFTSGAEDLALTIDNGLKKDTQGNDIALGAGETTLLTVEIRDQNGSYVTTPLDVAFSSGCAEGEKAEVDANATSVGGIAYSTYKNLGCDIATGDTVSVTISKGGNSVSEQVVIPVSPAKPQSIEFLDASESLLALKGTGGPQRKESSELSFKLINSLSGGAANQRIDFRLRAKHSDATLVPDSVRTDSQGEAKVIVSSGNVSSSFVVQACFIPADLIPTNSNDEVTCWQERFDACDVISNKPDGCPVGSIKLVPQDEAIMSVSSRLSVTSGLPVNSTMSLSVGTVNTETLNVSNVEIPVQVNVADRYGNFVHDGTKVFISAEGGAVGTVDGTQFNAELECETTDGRCSATWVSQNIIPFVTNKPSSDPRSSIDCELPNQVNCSTNYWGNAVDSYNPKKLYAAKRSYLIGQGTSNPSHEQIINVGNTQINESVLESTRNCNLYGEQSAPCINGILNAANDDQGVPLAGRATLIAITDGEENFNDVNGNGLFDENEFSLVYDVPEAFRDDNEDGVYGGTNCLPDSVTNPCSPLNSDAGHFEKLWDGNSDGAFTDRDRKYNGLSCTVEQQAANQCSKSIIDVFDSAEIIMSGSVPVYRFSVPIGSDLSDNLKVPSACSDVIVNDITALDLEPSDTADYCDVTGIDFGNTTIDKVEVILFFSDVNNNPLPQGTEISISTDNGLYSGPTDLTVSQSMDTKASKIAFIIGREIEANQKKQGQISIVFTTPAGVITTATLGVVDAG